MDINDYQSQIRNFIDYPIEIGPFTVILDLQKNVGNLSEKLNKSLTTDHGSFSKEDKIKIAISLGDILYNVTNMASDLGLTMNDVVSINLTKHTSK